MEEKDIAAIAAATARAVAEETIKESAAADPAANAMETFPPARPGGDSAGLPAEIEFFGKLTVGDQVYKGKIVCTVLLLDATVTSTTGTTHKLLQTLDDTGTIGEDWGYLG